MKKITEKITSLALILMFAITASMITIPNTQAAIEIPTFMLLSVAPDPVGVGQAVYLNAFASKPMATSSGLYGDYYKNITIQVVRPDGQKEILGPFLADAAAGIYSTYTPKTSGNYTFQVIYPGQTLVGYNERFPNQFINSSLIGSYYQPAESKIVTLVVQEEPIKGYAESPLPTEYWSRPIYGTNWEWAKKLGGNWLGLGGYTGGGFAVTGYYDATGGFDPYTTAPNTAHIMWTKPTADGGQVGGPITADSSSSYHGGSVYTSYFEPIIIDGVIYYDRNPGFSYYKDEWVAVDLRTGEEIWTKPCGITGTEWLRYGQVLMWHSIGFYGSNSYLWSLGSPTWTVSRSAPSGNMTLRLYDAHSGDYLAQIINAQNLNMIADTEATEQGTLLGWYIDKGNLTLWNSTRALAYPNGYSGEPLNHFRPEGTINWSAGIEWSVRVPTTLNNKTISLSIAAITPEVILLYQAPDIATYAAAGYAITAGYNARTGALLWGPLNQTVPQNRAIVYPTRLGGAADGVYIMIDKDVMEVYGYSLTDGTRLWGPVAVPSNAFSPLGVYMNIAYGNAYVWDYGGYVHALDLETGAIKWTFEPRTVDYYNAGKFTIWPYTTSICDGKIFLAEGSRYNPPMYSDARRLVLNATTGELIWDIMSWSPQLMAAHADGIMVSWNGYDKQIYTFGKGQTYTTVTASPKISVHGNGVLVEGMVTDESAGTKNSDRIARFPNGVPAVSDDSMTDWMEYVYMQQPKPTNATGVPVTLSVIDSNGNYREIGTTTSDATGFYSYQWTPDIEGKYTVIANFAGSESYYPSNAETSFVVNSPAATQSPYPVVSLPPTEMYIIAGVVAIIVAIAIVGALMLAAIKKRP